MDLAIEGSPFATAYFCRNLLPKDLIMEKINKYNESLIQENTECGMKTKR